eukprot:TRINITY_DN497_c1_g1_i2.p1 TRINITY_DN497_c1_g1~~TRINITY_DN497_c1_g1_i2.p1  ORF type:complete len:109 (+),score=1.70 TRINITY_DN497_c1_g1_i2:216-542(+)
MAGYKFLWLVGVPWTEARRYPRAIYLNSSSSKPEASQPRTKKPGPKVKAKVAKPQVGTKTGAKPKEDEDTKLGEPKKRLCGKCRKPCHKATCPELKKTGEKRSMSDQD